MNEQNEKYGAKLTLITSEFKNKLREVSSLIRNFGKEAEKETTIQPKISTTSKNELQELEKEYDKYEKQLEEIRKKFSSKTTKSGAMINIMPGESVLSGEVEKEYNDIIDKINIISNKINKIKKGEIFSDIVPYDIKASEQMWENFGNEVEETNDDLKETNNEVGELNKKSSKTTLGKLFDSSIRKIKRFTFYLLGARSAFSLFMKYQSIYYQYNQQMQYQSELSQNAIALSLAPAFELLGNVISYVSIAFARFIQLLTGVNVLSKVSTKGIRDYNKSLKETQTLVSGVDEITNLNMPSGTGLADQYKALKDFQDKVKEFDEWWNNFKADFIKWLWDPELIEKIGNEGLIPVTWDLLEGMFKGLYDSVLKKYVEEIVTKFKRDLQPIWEPLKIRLEEVWETMKPIWEKFFNPLKEKFDETKNYILQQNAPFINSLIDIWNNTFGWLFGKIDYIDTKTTTVIGDITKEQKEALNEMGIDVDKYTLKNKNDIAIIKSKFKNLTDDQKKKLKEVGIDIEAVATIGNENIDTLQENINDIGELDVEFDVNANTSGATNTLKSFFSKLGMNFGNGKLSTTIGLTIKSVGDTLSTAWENVKKAFGFAKGLDYVPYDEFPALLHKGEAVVPAKYNPTIHSTGNEYTNSLLETLIMKVDDLSKRPNEFNIDGQKFASATYSLYEEQRSKQNYVEGVVVR